MATSKPPARAARACIPCKTSKKRCSGSIPCANCVKHRRAALCRHADINAAWSVLTADIGASILTSGVSVSASSKTRPSLAAQDHSDSMDAVSPETANAFVSPRVLTDARGNQVYVGPGAVISFLSFLRELFKQDLGVSDFTEQVTHGTMLESVSSFRGQEQLQDTTSLKEKVELVQIFFAATAGVLDNVNKSDITGTLPGNESGRAPSKHQAAVNNLVIAIGARCHPDAMASRLCEQLHFYRCRPYLSLDNLVDLNMDTIRIFVLAAFYMLCACNRNMGYMYLDLAARAAHTLGLHHVGFEGILNEEEKATRLRILETLVSSFLGRPAATIHPLGERDVSLKSSSTTSARRQSIDSIYKLMKIADDVLVMDWKTPSNPAGTKAVIDRLAVWSKTLSAGPSADALQTTSLTSHQELTLAHLHLTCSYYYATMLATRPFLCLNCLQNRNVMQAADFPNGITVETSTSAITLYSDLALLTKSCEDAAVFMISACHDALQQGALLDNMCLLQAFVFSASLILGLILFTDENAARDVRRSLTNAIEVMRKISGRSRQAEHYLFILRDMQTDIERFQERQATSRRESSHRPVKRLMQQSAAQGSSPFVDGSDLLLARSSSGSTGASGSGGMTAFPFSSTMFSDAENGASTWNFPHIQFWDDLSAFGTG